MNKEFLDSFVELMAVDLEISNEWLRKWLEIYYQMRRAKEEAEETAKTLSIYRAFSADDLNAAIEEYEARPSPAEEIIAAAAEPAAAPPPETEAPGEEPAGKTPLDGFEAVEVKSEYLRGTAARKFKRDTRERLEAARKDRGLSLQAIADAADGLKMQDLLSILEGALVDYRVYKALAAALDRLNA